jgi:hypothetical protein
MKNYKTMTAATLAALTLLLSACGGSDDKAPASGVDGDVSNLKIENKTLLFYNATTGKQYVVDAMGTSNKLISLDENRSSALSREGKEAGELLYWPWVNTEGKVTAEKVVMLKSDYSYKDENLTHENFHYLGDILVTPPHAHFSSEFNATAIAAAPQKANVLNNLNKYLKHQAEIKEELEEALEELGADLCTYYVPAHADHEEGHEHHELFYAMGTDGKVYVFEEEEGEAGAHGELEKIAGPISLTGVSSCKKDEVGMTSSSDNGVYIFAKETQRVYLFDRHELPDGTYAAFHQHGGGWALSSFMPAGFDATQMIGFGAGEHTHP